MITLIIAIALMYVLAGLFVIVGQAGIYYWEQFKEVFYCSDCKIIVTEEQFRCDNCNSIMSICVRIRGDNEKTK